MGENSIERKMGFGDQKLEKQIGKQVGCMTGFLHIFDRHAGKRISSAKRLPPPPPPETHGASPPESSKPETQNEPPKTQTPCPLPVLEFKEATTTRKFSKEAPRLSLDSRAVADARGSFHPREVEKQRRSTSVVAKLMGLEDSDSDSDPELRRSASESRIPKEDLVLPKQQYRFFDTTNFQLKQLQNHHVDKRASDPNARGMMRQKKSFFDSADFFPGTKQSVSVVHGEIERRLKMRGIDEPSKDLDALKQILEALQLKGLLHSKNSMLPLNHRNFVYDGSFSYNDSPIVVMKPGRSSGSLNQTRFTGNDSPPASAFRSRQEPGRNVKSRNPNSPTQSPNRLRKGTITNAEKQRKVNDGGDRKRTSPVHSPRVNSRLNGPDRQATSRSPRMRQTNRYQKEEKAVPVVAATVEDESSTVSDSSFSTSSYTDTEVCIIRLNNL